MSSAKLKNVVVLLFLFFVLVWGASTSGKLSVSPLGIDVKLPAGQSSTGSFLVKNIGDESSDISVSLNDYARTLDGKNQFSPAGTLPQSLTPFVTISPATFKLEPDAVQEVQFQVTLPQTETGPHWMLFLVRELKPSLTAKIGVEGGEGGVGFNVNLVFGIRVRQTDPGSAVADGRVTSMNVSTPEAGRPLAVQMTFENTGSTFLRPAGRVEIKDRTGQTVANLPIDRFRVLPRGKRVLDVALEESLPAGKYIALGIIDFEGDFLVAGQAAFEIKK